MKTDTVFKRAFNDMLDLVKVLPAGTTLASEHTLSAALGISRTTVRKVLRQMSALGMIGVEGRGRMVRDPVRPDAYFPVTETEATSSQVERQFMEWMLRADTMPGAQINELKLARRFGVGTTGIREFLNRFSRFGLIEKRPNAGWRFKGFTSDFALELFEIRELFEPRSAQAFAKLPDFSSVWPRLAELEEEHRNLGAALPDRFHDFSDLDNRFHRLINEAAPNRFIDDFYDIITFIFHYHYQWNKSEEMSRNGFAIAEHLDYIAALKSRDPARIDRACRSHLASARQTLLQAIATA